MLLHKTAKAHNELQPGHRTLPLRERAILLLPDATSMDRLQQMYGQDSGPLVERLLADGYLRASAATPPAAVSSQAVPAAASVAAAHKQAATAAHLNLAGSRMYLFDLCERMFAKRHETQAQQFREMLREARDLASLQQAAQALLAGLETVAGKERADTLRDRLPSLLRV